MTIRLPKFSFGDRILKTLGKKRGLRLPAEAHEKFGPYVSALAQKESFWKALFRSKNADLPDGYVDLFSFERHAHGEKSLRQ